jgi:hypothetical protein
MRSICPVQKYISQEEAVQKRKWISNFLFGEIGIRGAIAILLSLWWFQRRVWKQKYSALLALVVQIALQAAIGKLTSLFR